MNLTPKEKKQGQRLNANASSPWKKDWKENRVLYLLFIPMLVYAIIFSYIPMVGILMAFENYKVSRGLFKSEWIGLANFVELFSGEEFPRAFRNNLMMGLLNTTIGFVMPIVFALLLSMLKSKKYKRPVQVMSYMPNFVSATVVCALVTEFLGRSGAVTKLLSLFGFPVQNWLANPNIPVFWLINTFTNIWCGIGWGSIIYVAAISTVNGDLHEAAALDGANRFQRMVKITLPCILPTIIMMWTLNIGTSMLAGFDKILLLYMPTTYETADVLQTYTHRLAFGGTSNYGLSAAVGLFQSILGTTMLLLSNRMNRKVSGMSLF